MKKIILSFLILSTLTGSSQERTTSLAAGAGVLDTNGAVIQLKFQYEFKQIGISAGMITTGIGGGPAFFTAELFAPIRLSNYDRFVIHAGYAYKMQSADNTKLNGHRFLAGINYERGIFNGVNVYIGPTIVNKKAFMFTIGANLKLSGPDLCD